MRLPRLGHAQPIPFRGRLQGQSSIGRAGADLTIPYRPSVDPDCTGGGWQAANGTCYNGLATRIVFDFAGEGVLLPGSVIFAVSYNTTHYGSAPIGESAPCFAEIGGNGCGYDAPNVSAASTTPRKGIDDNIHGVFLNSSWSGAYCDNGANGTGTFRLDSPCWTDQNPMVLFTARR